eukprot:g19334.t1
MGRVATFRRASGAGLPLPRSGLTTGQEPPAAESAPPAPPTSLFLSPKSLPEVCSDVCCDLICPALADPDTLTGSILTEIVNPLFSSVAESPMAHQKAAAFPL